MPTNVSSIAKISKHRHLNRMVKYRYKRTDVSVKQELRKQDGFTMLELIIVMIAIIILVAVALYFYG